jgi:FAD/FMN-containing dehydrogenase
MRKITRRDVLLGIPATALTMPRRQSIAATPDFSSLQSRFSGQLITPESASYENLRRTNNLAFDRRPVLIARCTNTNDVVRTLDFARSHHLPVAVRGGGHSLAGYSSCDGGVVIALERMDAVSVDPAALTITCRGGVRVWQANEAGAKHGMALPLGICPDVGVSGLTLGGGVGYLMGVAGAACDTLIGAEVVMADGRVLNVTADRDADLMWALRGAGANFGIVTRLTYRAYPLDKVFGGSLTFPSAAAGDVLALLNTLSMSIPDELSVFGQIAYLPSQDALVNLDLCWSGDTAHGRDVIAQHIASVIRPIKDSMKETTLAQLSGNEMSPAEPQCARFGNVAGQLPQIALDRLMDGSGAPAAVRVIFFDPIHGAVTRIKPDATSFPHRPQGAAAGLILSWRDPSNTAEVRAWADKSWATLQPYIPNAYVNMLDDEGAARVRDSYGGNYERLRRLKTKFDPQNIFRSNQNILPA